MSAQHTLVSMLEIGSDRNGYFARFETCKDAYVAKRQHDTAPDLLAIVERVEALLTGQKWKDYGFGAEAQILRDARAVLTKIHGNYE